MVPNVSGFLIEQDGRYGLREHLFSRGSGVPSFYQRELDAGADIVRATIETTAQEIGDEILERAVLANSAELYRAHEFVGEFERGFH